MSAWYEVTSGDISVDNDKREFDILVTSNDRGNIYSILTFEQVKRMYEITIKPNKD